MAQEDEIETGGQPEVTEEAEARPTLGQRFRKRALKTLLVGVLGLFALIVAVVFGIDTGPGHRFVANQIGGLKFENGMRISVGRIDGSLYGQFTLHDLSVRDPKGEFLFSPEIHIDWRPFAYLSNHVDVRSATAQRMILRRTPAFKETPPSEGPLLPDLDIDVGQLRIDRFIVEPPVSGKLRVVTIDGRTHIADGRAQVYAKGGTLAVQDKEGGDRFDLTLDAVPAKNRLDIDLDLHAPTGGLIAALGGLTQPLDLTIKGKGDWARWNGALNADLGEGELARLDLAARDGTFAIEGPTRIARLLSGSTASLLGPVTNFDLKAALDQRRAALSGMISSDAFNLTPNGTVDLANNSFDQLVLDFVLLKPSAIAPNLSGAGVRAQLSLDGAFSTPAVDYEINAKRLVMNDMGLQNLSAAGAAKVDSGRILIPVSARVSRITGLDSVAGGSLTDVKLSGDVAIDGARVLSDNMRIRSNRIDAGVVLVADVSKGLYTGAIDGRIDNYRMASVGVFNISTNMDLRSEGQGFALQGNVKAQSTKLLNENLQNYLGGNFAASSNVRYGSDGVVRFSDLRLNAPDLRVVGGQGSWSPGGRIALTADGTSDRYGAIGIRVTGTLSDPDAHLTAERPDLGIGLANLDARVTGASGGYNFVATGDTDYGPLQADVTLGMGERTSLQINNADLSGVKFAGKLDQTAAGPFAGQLTANGNGVGGILKLDAQGRYQAVDFNLRAKNSVFDGPAQLAIGSAIIDGRAVLYDQPLVVADAQLSETSLGGFDLAAARVQVDYRDGRGKAKAVIEGVSGVPFRLGVNADLTPEIWRVALRGRVRGQTIKTLSPARIVPKDQGYELMPTAISVGGGTVKLAGSCRAGSKASTWG